MQSRIDLAASKMGSAKTPDELSDTFADVEGALDGKVPYDDLAAAYKANETRIENAGE